MRGWRFFHCWECHHEWSEATRDHLSPSGDNCPKCGEWEFPHGSVADTGIPVDDFGNLIR